MTAEGYLLVDEVCLDIVRKKFRDLYGEKDFNFEVPSFLNDIWNTGRDMPNRIEIPIEEHNEKTDKMEHKFNVTLTFKFEIEDGGDGRYIVCEPNEIVLVDLINGTRYNLE